MSQFLGSFYCDHCSQTYRMPVWLLNGARLCAQHFEHVAGYPPPRPPSSEDLRPTPPAEHAWQRVVPGLRARHSEAAQHGLELQGVRNLRLGEATSTVGDTGVWTVPDAQLVELVLLASPYRDASEPDKAMVRVALLRILHGTERP